MSRSILGQVICNSAASDDGNMQVLEKVETETQREIWLQPIVNGDLRSALVMTNWHPARVRTLPG